MPVPLTRIPRILQRAVILAEDARFYEHDGVDLEAMQDAVNYDLGQGRHCPRRKHDLPTDGEKSVSLARAQPAAQVA